MMGSTRASSAEGLQLLNIVAMLIVLVATVALPNPPPRQNSCHLDRILNSGAMMRERVGAIRTRIQRQSGGAVAAAGECNGGVGCA